MSSDEEAWEQIHALENDLKRLKTSGEEYTLDNFLQQCEKRLRILQAIAGNDDLPENTALYIYDLFGTIGDLATGLLNIEKVAEDLLRDTERDIKRIMSESLPVVSEEPVYCSSDDYARQLKADWDRLCDWFLAHIGKPIIDPAEPWPFPPDAYDFDECEHWVSEVRKRSRWDNVFSTHARRNYQVMQDLCEKVIGPSATSVSTSSTVSDIIRTDILALRKSIIKVCADLAEERSRPAPWFNFAIELLESIPSMEELEDIGWDEWSDLPRNTSLLSGNVVSTTRRTPLHEYHQPGTSTFEGNSFSNAPTPRYDSSPGSSPPNLDSSSVSSNKKRKLECLYPGWDLIATNIPSAESPNETASFSHNSSISDTVGPISTTVRYSGSQSEQRPPKRKRTEYSTVKTDVCSPSTHLSSISSPSSARAHSPTGSTFSLDGTTVVGGDLLKERAQDFNTPPASLPCTSSLSPPTPSDKSGDPSPAASPITDHCTKSTSWPSRETSPSGSDSPRTPCSNFSSPPATPKVLEATGHQTAPSCYDSQGDYPRQTQISSGSADSPAIEDQEDYIIPPQTQIAIIRKRNYEELQVPVAFPHHQADSTLCPSVAGLEHQPRYRYFSRAPNGKPERTLMFRSNAKDTSFHPQSGTCCDWTECPYANKQDDGPVRPSKRPNRTRRDSSTSAVT
ncbi:hypothetical protein FRC14_003334 [Serendipita sp. 396]|nr:hypothetical protein FRC14_003334 [Serendipita sp. 396]KAG8780103.1 hypothetical protein FRC15_009749 [Serendipita sp. 397]KAG8799454.1 hypothetical protein FRC16_005079 [Serendipita sp. 398]KAG8855194.1 hypothetical protein FRC20_000832 [Serendipita sp. 405]